MIIWALDGSCIAPHSDCLLSQSGTQLGSKLKIRLFYTSNWRDLLGFVSRFFRLQLREHVARCTLIILIQNRSHLLQNKGNSHENSLNFAKHPTFLEMFCCERPQELDLVPWEEVVAFQTWAFRGTGWHWKSTCMSFGSGGGMLDLQKNHLKTAKHIISLFDMEQKHHHPSNLYSKLMAVNPTGVPAKQVPRKHSGHPPSIGLWLGQNVIDLGCTKIHPQHTRVAAKKWWANDSHTSAKSGHLWKFTWSYLYGYVFPPYILGISKQPWTTWGCSNSISTNVCHQVPDGNAAPHLFRHPWDHQPFRTSADTPIAGWCLVENTLRWFGDTPISGNTRGREVWASVLEVTPPSTRPKNLNLPPFLTFW